MAKKDFAAGITKSIQAETQKVQDRFAKAEQLLEPESTRTSPASGETPDDVSSPKQPEPEKPKNQKRSVLELIEESRSKHALRSAEDIDRQLQEERYSWDS